MSGTTATLDEMRSTKVRGLVPAYRDLVRCASLAASSHNTQPWKFRLDGDAISILPDFSRRCPVVDPDDHHLWVSLGCATENLLLAAQSVGLRGDVAFDPREGGTVRVTFEDAAPLTRSSF
jgi:hypothetical protein